MSNLPWPSLTWEGFDVREGWVDSVTPGDRRPWIHWPRSHQSWMLQLYLHQVTYVIITEHHATHMSHSHQRHVKLAAKNIRIGTNVGQLRNWIAKNSRTKPNIVKWKTALQAALYKSCTYSFTYLLTYLS